MIKLKSDKSSINAEIYLPASKSESNRALIIQTLLEQKNLINNISLSGDTQNLVKILNDYQNGESVFDVGPAGTTFRFLTAFFALKQHTQTLTGSTRMKQRPVQILVDALNKIGSSISYIEKTGFPPLNINEGTILGGKIKMKGDVSSQYISALMLIAPVLPKGIEIKIKGDLVSRPYVEMTASLMRYFGAQVDFKENIIRVIPKPYQTKKITIEPDWSAASYWYEILAFSKEGTIKLPGLKKQSLQGDSVVGELFSFFGIKTRYTNYGIVISKQNEVLPEYFEFDFTFCPDLAQTLAVTCSGLGVTAKLTGLKTLKIKETDRIKALKTELNKFGIETEISDEEIKILPNNKIKTENIKPIETYHDHRMAMSFAPLVLKTKELSINKPEVVGKSYPEFWEDFSQLDISIIK